MLQHADSESAMNVMFEDKKSCIFHYFCGLVCMLALLQIRNDGEMSAGGIFARVMLEFQALWRLGGRLAQGSAGSVRAGESREGREELWELPASAPGLPLRVRMGLAGTVLPTSICRKRDRDGGCPDALAGVIRGSH